MKREQGYSMYEMLMAIAIISILMSFIIPLYLKQLERDDTKAYPEYLLTVVSALQRYQYHKVSVDKVNPGSTLSWPASLEYFMSDYNGMFWEACSNTEESKGLCKRPDRIPWTTAKLKYEAGTLYGDSYAYLTVDMPTTDTPEYARWSSAIARIPHAKIQPDGTIRIKIQDLNMALYYREALKRDGSTKLTADWDVGGDFAITNAKDFTIRNSDGSQRSLAAGPMTQVAGHNELVNKHACPEAFTPGITTSIKGLFNETSVPIAFKNLGSIRTYAVDNTASWTIKLDYWAEVQGVKTLLHDGEVNVQLICQPDP